MATEKQVMDTQMQITVRVTSEMVRQQLESEDAKTVAVSKLQTLAETLATRTKRRRAEHVESHRDGDEAGCF